MKKILSLLLAVLMTLSFCACGTSSDFKTESAADYSYAERSEAPADTAVTMMAEEYGSGANGLAASDAMPDTPSAGGDNINPDKIIYSADTTIETTEFDETIAAADYVVSDALKKGEFAFADELTMEMIENIPQRAESFYYRYVYNVKVNKLEHALKCLVKLRELPPPPRSRIGVNMKAYNAKEREERIEEIWRQVKYNHQTMNTDARVYDSVQQAIDATQFMQTLY